MVIKVPGSTPSEIRTAESSKKSVLFTKISSKKPEKLEGSLGKVHPLMEYLHQ